MIGQFAENYTDPRMAELDAILTREAANHPPACRHCGSERTRYSGYDLDGRARRVRCNECGRGFYAPKA